jgi:ribosomal protein L11
MKKDFIYEIKTNPKQRLLKLKLPARQAVAAPPLTPLLGQVGINAVQFCQQFNKLDFETEDFFPTNVSVELLGGKAFNLKLNKPSGSDLLKQVRAGSSSKTLNVLAIYKVFLVLSEYVMLTPKSFRGFLKASKIRAIEGIPKRKKRKIRKK